MRRDLPLIASLVFDTPLMIHNRKADTILKAIGPRILEGFELAEGDFQKPERHARVGVMRYFSGGGYLGEYGIGVLPILGTLVRRGTWLDAMSGLTSYSEIMAGFDEMMMDSSVRAVMLELDTPGGEAGGVFDLSQHIREVMDYVGKPVWAHANEMAASAGYAIACAANEIWIPTTGEVGSIGVLAAHLDVSEADRMLGERWTYIYAGEEKVDGNMHEPLSDRALETIQSDVDALYDMFVDLVSQNRGIAAEKIRDTKAGMFRGRKAVESGLADEFGTFDEALEALASHVDDLQT
jgi:signal peptide peptidase SppA